MITAAKLRNHTVKDLAAMAKGEGVCGWHAMRKEQLVKALLKLAREEAAAGRKGKRKGGMKNRVALMDSSASSRDSNGRNSDGRDSDGRDSSGRFKSAHSSISADGRRRLIHIREKLAAAKSLACKAEKERREAATDLLTLTVKDPFWLHAYWELTSQSIRRAQVSLGRHWHTAEPVLRLLEIKQDDPSAKHPIRDIVVHGGVNNWYIDVTEPHRSYQVEIGYRATNGRFLCLAKSYVVSTTIKQVFEKHSQCGLEPPLNMRFGLGAQNKGCENDNFSLEVDAEVTVFGVSEPGSRITLKGEPIATSPDGTFTVRFPLPNRRQVFPVVANSVDGMEQQTVVLAVERNTKVMAPVLRDLNR